MIAGLLFTCRLRAGTSSVFAFGKSTFPRGEGLYGEMKKKAEEKDKDKDKDKAK